MLRRTIGMIPHAAIAVKNSIYGNTKAPKPVYMQIEPTNYCNEKCIYCQRQGALTDINNKTLGLAEFKKIIDNLPSVKEIMLSGFGEPLLNNELCEMIKYAKSKGIRVQTTTNMILIDYQKAKDILASGLDELFVSIDSPCPEIYHKLRGVPIEPALAGLKNLTAARKDLGVFNKKPKVFINAIFTNTTKDTENIKKLIDLAKENHIILRLKSLHVWGKNPADLSTSSGPAIKEIKKYAKLQGVNIKINLKKRYSTLYCYRIWFGGFINSKGELFACCDNVKEPCFGNILQNDFEAIWNGKEFRDFRKKLYERDLSAFTPYVRTNCTNCNLQFNDKLYPLSKVLNFWRHN